MSDRQKINTILKIDTKKKNAYSKLIEKRILIGTKVFLNETLDISIFVRDSTHARSVQYYRTLPRNTERREHRIRYLCL